MNERVEAEVELVQSRYPDLEFREEDGWARIPAYAIPPGWQVEIAEVAFLFPAGLPAQKPYGFWVRPPLELPDGGAPSNATPGPENPFGTGWQQFSWDVDWAPGAEPTSGTNMLDWVRSFAQRLREVN
jgi:hypothetical protein